MPVSKDEDGMEIPENIFEAEEQVYRFRSMPDPVQEVIVQDQEKVQELVQSIYDYREFFSQRLGTEALADDRLRELLNDASKLQPEITRKFNETNPRGIIQQGDPEQLSMQRIRAIMREDEELDTEGLREILGDDDYDVDVADAEEGRRTTDLQPGDIGRILGDDDFELSEGVGALSLSNNTNVTQENIQQILGDNNYSLEQQGLGAGGWTGELNPEEVQRILGDGDFNLEDDGELLFESGQLDPDNVQHILGDDDFNLEDDGEVPLETGELNPDDVQRILGDNDFDLEDNGEVPPQTGELSLEDVRRILGDDDINIEGDGVQLAQEAAENDPEGLYRNPEEYNLRPQAQQSLKRELAPN